jgi:hypothetical protein
MNRKAVAGLLLGLGAILIIVGLVVMLVIVPGMKQFPDNVDTTRTYTGTMAAYFNTSAFEFMTDLDITLERHFETEDTDGDLALVLEEQQLLSGDQVLQTIIKRYAIDRETMLFSDEYPDSWAEKEGFAPRGGLVLGWPLDTEKKDYPGWSDDYQHTVTLEFVEEVEHDRADMDTYYFISSSGPEPIDPSYVAQIGLPTGLPKDQFTALIEQTNLDEQVKRLLPLLLRGIEGDTVPLQYYYEYEAEYWIEPQTGVLIETTKHELRKVGLSEEMLADSPLASLGEEERAGLRVDVFDMTYGTPDETVQDAKEDAEDAINMIQIAGTYVPAALIIAGVVLGLVSIVLFTRKP